MGESHAADDALLDLGGRSVEGLRRLLDQLSEEEQKISYRRRVLHGKIDILRAELVRRLKQEREENRELVSGADIERLIEILSNESRGVSRADVTADDDEDMAGRQR